jgi:hypothetical protein
MEKKIFFVLIPLIFLLTFCLSGCLKNQKVNTDIWSENEDSGSWEEFSSGAEEEADQETLKVTEVPKNKKDIRKLLDDLEKDAGAMDLEVEEDKLDKADEEESGYIDDEVEEDVSDGDIDEL